MAAKFVMYQRPSLADFITVCMQAPADQREQYQAFAGEEYDGMKVAALFSLREHLSWVLYADEDPVALGGFDEIRAGVWQDWLFSTPAAFETHWRTVSKVCRRIIDTGLQQGAHRVQCVSLASRTRAHEWYRVLGYKQEGVLQSYGVRGEDAIMFARVRN